MPSSKRVIMLSCTMWVVFLTVILNALPLIQSLGTESSTVYYASDAEIVIEKDVYGSMWNTSETIEVDFMIKDPPHSVNVMAPFEWELLANFSRWQTTRVEYLFMLNGEVSRVVIEDLVGTSFNAIGSYESKPLNNSLLKIGANKFTLKINVASTCKDVCHSYFKLIIRNLRVQNHVIDIDRDSIWDNIDQLPVNNHVFTAFISAITTPMIGYLSLVLRKTWKGKSLGGK